MSQEHLDQGELAGGEVGGVAIAVESSGVQVQANAVVSENVGSNGLAWRTQAALNTRQQLIEAERFGHVIVGPTAQSRHGVVDPVAGREDQDGQVDRTTAKGMQHCEPIEFGEPDVQDHQVELATASHGKGLNTARHHGRR